MYLVLSMYIKSGATTKGNPIHICASQGKCQGGQVAYLEDRIEEKLRENNRRMRKNEETFLFIPPKVESLATPLEREGNGPCRNL